MLRRPTAARGPTIRGRQLRPEGQHRQHAHWCGRNYGPKAHNGNQHHALTANCGPDANNNRRQGDHKVHLFYALCRPCKALAGCAKRKQLPSALSSPAQAHMNSRSARQLGPRATIGPRANNDTITINKRWRHMYIADINALSHTRMTHAWPLDSHLVRRRHSLHGPADRNRRSCQLHTPSVRVVSIMPIAFFRAPGGLNYPSIGPYDVIVAQACHVGMASRLAPWARKRHHEMHRNSLF